MIKESSLINKEFISRLDAMYLEATGTASVNDKSSLSIVDAFPQFINENTIIEIGKFLSENDYISERLIKKEGELYESGVALFVFMAIKKKRNRLLADWPLLKTDLDPFASLLGISLNND